MKIWLDDMRQEPEGWVRCHWPFQVIDFLKTGRVTHLSLDHDLGCFFGEERTGYEVMTFLDEYCHFNPEFKLPEITFHTANPVGLARMNRVYLKLKNRPIYDHSR